MPAPQEARFNNRAVSDVVREAVENVEDIIRYEIRLARIELKQEAVKAGIAIGALTSGGIIAGYGFAFLLVAMYIGISHAIWPWLSALIIGVFLSMVGAAVAGYGYRRLRRLRPKPERTLETLREDVQWLRRQTR